MAVLMLEGFDKYGGANSTTVAALMAGEWTSFVGSAFSIVAPLSTTGQALSMSMGTVTSIAAIRTLAANYSRLIGGFRFSASLAGNKAVITFRDTTTGQCTIVVNTTGTIALYNGTSSGSVIATSTASVTANSTHYLEFDITFAASGAYQLWLDGVSILSGTGNTKASANTYANGFALGDTAGNGATSVVTWDDLYLFDTTGSVNNAALLTSPRIETTLPISDSAVQFAIGASVLGGTVSRTAGAVTISANNLYVRPFTPARACTLNSLTFAAVASSGTVNLRPVVYADSAGVPGTLITAGSTVTGITNGATTTMALTSPPSLVAGTQYWLGYMSDTGVASAIAAYDLSAAGRTVTSTFASGAPSTCPATTAGQTTIVLWGNITLSSAANYYEVSQSPPPAANTSYVTDTTVNHEDLYNFANLSVIPASVYAVAVKAYCARSDSGARTVSLRVSSGGTDGGGSSTGQTPGTSYGWIGSHFERDPNGSIAWTGTALNAATTGFKIDA